MPNPAGCQSIKQRLERGKNHVCVELHSFGDGARHDGGGSRREREVEGKVRVRFANHLPGCEVVEWIEEKVSCAQL